MPLVEENRKLHAENMLLRQEIENLSVRLDALMEKPFNYKQALRFVTVHVNPLTVYLDNRERNRQVALDLADKLLVEIPYMAKKLEPAAHVGVDYRFAFLSWGDK
jgi:hypothetical protein